ncbi:unnamed protein product [Bathycoccus prasinos]
MQPGARYETENSIIERQKCPKWIEDYTGNAEFCSSKKFLRITPLQGFGNKLNGILQGTLGAYWLDRCLLINWAYGDLLSTYSQKEHLNTDVEYQSAGSLQQNKVPKYEISFPKSFKGMKKLKSGKYLNPIIDMEVGFRDRFCTVIQAQQLDLGLMKRSREQLKRSRTLCVFLEKCILQSIIRPNEILRTSIAEIQKRWLSKDSVSVGVHLRMGDYISIKQEDQHFLKTGGDERVPKQALDLFWETVNLKAERLLKETGRKSSAIFIATDNQFALNASKYALGSESIYYTEGLYRHSDLEYRNDSSTIKMLTDWLLLSKAEIVIQGPWSTFIDKSLVYASRKQHIVRCHILPQKLKKKYLISQRNGWGCFKNVLKDTFKGPRAIDLV